LLNILNNLGLLARSKMKIFIYENIIDKFIKFSEDIVIGMFSYCAKLY